MRHKDGTEQATQQVLVHEQDDQEAQHKGLGISYLISSVYLNFTYVKLRITCNFTPSNVTVSYGSINFAVDYRAA